MAKASHRKRYPCASDDVPHKAKMSRCRRVKYTNTIEPSTEEVLSVKKEMMETEETESAEIEKQVFRKFPKYKSQNVNKNFVRHSSAKPYLVSKQLVHPSKRS